MYAYIKINYEFVIKEKFYNRKLLDITGILLVIMLLCILAGIKGASLPAAEAMAENQYISGHTGENSAAISEPVPDIGMHDNLLYENPGLACVNRLNQVILLPVLPSIVQPQTDGSFESAIQKTADLPQTEAIIPEAPSDILPGQKDIPDIPDNPEISEPLPDETTAAPDSLPDSDPSEEDSDNQDFLCKGFLCDASGKIIGCQDVSVTDGVLCLPSDAACTGIRANALASLSMQIYEIYIPANIVTIEEGAFNGLPELYFIEVHPDNPVYGSTEGFLYTK